MSMGFDLNDPDATRVTRKDSPLPKIMAPNVRREAGQHALDSEPMTRLFSRLMDTHTRELDRQYENRREMALDEDFYDHLQWDANDAETLRERGQLPLVYNIVAPVVNWITGTEKRARADFKILPRRKEEAKQAERKTALMKYLSDQNRSVFNRSDAFEESVKAGVSWLEDGVRDDLEGEPVYDRYESWRNVLWDSASRERDVSDARYVNRSRWMDADIGASMFRDRARIVEESIDDADRYFLGSEYGDEPMDSQEVENELTGRAASSVRAVRDRFRCIESWFTRIAETPRLKGGEFHGEIFDEYSEAHVMALNKGWSDIVVKPMLRMHVAVFTLRGLLWVSESPYRHNRFPFTPIWCYRRARDGMPYGIIRGLRDVQTDVNKSASKILHILSTVRTVMDEGAVDDIDEYLEEVARPDATIVKKSGKELSIDTDRADVQYHMERMSRSIAMVQQESGVTDENLGRNTNARSGVAIARRQDQGSVTTTKVFDNLRFAVQVSGEKKLSLQEQFFTQKKSFRITNMRGTPDYVDINDGLPENDIARCKADYVISEADWRATVRQAQAEALLDLLGNLAKATPQIALALLDLVVEHMDLPNQEEIVRRIRQITGMRDPDADEPTPEEIARAEEQAKQKAIQDAMLQAELRKLLSEGEKNMAQARQIAAKMVGDNTDAINSAIAAAMATMATPAIAPVSDFILKEAGFVSQTEQDRKAAMAAAIAEGQASGEPAPVADKVSTQVMGG